MKKDKNVKILIIDDDKSILKLTGTLLRNNGYNVVLSNDAPEGVETAMKINPDLILLDVMMPIINGYNICRLLKSQEEYKNIPIILLTSRTKEADRRLGKEVGANAYIAKPFSVTELLSKVNELLLSKN